MQNLVNVGRANDEQRVVRLLQGIYRSQAPKHHHNGSLEAAVRMMTMTQCRTKAAAMTRTALKLMKNYSQN